ncbi:hypothetical protein [Fibrella arboris]|uniref:hypothetical protein n=1 Tax=Fibrella arboris TaxID=3242486 RepID=UPI003521F6AE
MSVAQPHQPVPPAASKSSEQHSYLWRLSWLYALVFTALPILVVGWAWSKAAVNVPKWDDHALKEFLLALEQQTSPLGWFRQVIKQHNEHRIAYDRLLTWADYTFFGKLSFKRLMVYGDLSLLALVALFGWFTSRYTKHWLLFLPPVALFIISLAQWENLYWALSSIQNFSIVGWSLACLLVLSHQSRIGWAIGLAIIATLVSGNGFLVWPIGFFLLVAQRRFQALIPWGIAAILLIAVYFGDYVQPTTHPPTRGSAAELAGGCLAFIGAAAEALPISKPYLFSMLLGGTLLVFWLTVLIPSLTRLGKKIAWTPLESFGLGALAFILGTAIVVVWGRYGYGQDTLLTSRYRIYSLTLLALTYTYWLSAAYSKQAVSSAKAFWAAGCGLLVSGLLWWSAFRFNTHESIFLRRMLLTMQYNWTYTGNRPESAIDATTRRLIDNSPAFYDAALPAFFTESSAPLFPIDTLFKRDHAYVVRLGTTGQPASMLPTLANPDLGVNVLLRSTKRTYLYGALPTPRRHWRVLVNRLPLYTADAPIELGIPIDELEVGTYKLFVVQYTAEQPAGVVRPTTQLLTVAPHKLSTGPVKNW